MSNENWRPAADAGHLRARAKLLQDIRHFFAEAGLLEVETPLLSSYSNTDPQIQPITAQYQSAGAGSKQTRFLQSSPEFAMKRLLAAGSGPIFQICKAFRNGEQGSRHNPEFSMLEWYRPGFDEQQLMDEVMSLVQELLPLSNWQRLSYQDLFLNYLDIDPFAMGSEELAARASQLMETSLPNTPDTRDTWLDLLFSHAIEPLLQDPVFIYDYPPSQAALAQIESNDKGQLVARRFELVIGGMEIANGYRELADPVEQRRRFLQDLQADSEGQRRMDEQLLSALEHGLPPCAGVALGLDRLLMLQCGAGSIEEVLSFPFDRA